MTRRKVLRWAGYVAVAVLFAIACGFLSHWQFARSEARNAQLALIEQNYNADPVPLADVVDADGAVSDDAEWLPVEITGEYLVDAQLLARNRAHGGTSAFEVLVPFATTDGRVIVIDRGWVPPADDSPEPDAIPAPVEGEITVVARIRPSEALPRSGRGAPGGQVPTINVPLVLETAGVADGVGVSDVYGLMVSETPAAAATPQPVEDPSNDPGPHLSYAIQWILFAVMGFAFIGYMIRTELRARAEEAAERERAPRRRRDRDMEAEDALLDELPR